MPTIEKPENVSGDAQVYGAARVSGDARVYGAAQVSGDARVFGGYVGGGARVNAPQHVQTYRDREGALWTCYRTELGSRIVRRDQPVEPEDAPEIVRLLAVEVAR